MSSNNFTFDRERNVYVCPANKLLRTTDKAGADHKVRYRSSRQNVKMATDTFARRNGIACAPWRQLAVQKSAHSGNAVNPPPITPRSVADDEKMVVGSYCGTHVKHLNVGRYI